MTCTLASASTGSCELARLLAQAPCYITILDRAGNIAWANRADYGIDPGGVVGMAGDALLPEADRPSWRAAFLRARDGRDVAPFSCTLVVPEAPGLVRIEGRLSPVVEDGRVSWVVAVCRNVPEPMPQPQPLATPTPSPSLPPRPLLVPAGALWLSPLGVRVVTHLSGRGREWTTAEDLALAVGEVHGHRFRASLTAMADRRILEASSGHGYRLSEG